MFEIQSNVADAISRTERLQRKIPDAMQKALSPELWFAQARLVAQRTLLAIAATEERKFIQPFVDTVTVDLLESVLSLKMHSPFAGRSADQVLETARAAAATLTPREIVETRGLNLFMQQVESFEALVLQWVQGEGVEGDNLPYPDEQAKRKDARDWGKTDEDVARFISYLMLAPDPSDGERKAREALEPHIAKYIANRLADGLHPAIAEVWLKAVLAAWRAMLCAGFPKQLQRFL